MLKRYFNNFLSWSRAFQLYGFKYRLRRNASSSTKTNGIGEPPGVKGQGSCKSILSLSRSDPSVLWKRRCRGSHSLAIQYKRRGIGTGHHKLPSVAERYYFRDSNFSTNRCPNVSETQHHVWNAKGVLLHSSTNQLGFYFLVTKLFPSTNMYDKWGLSRHCAFKYWGNSLQGYIKIYEKLPCWRYACSKVHWACVVWILNHYMFSNNSSNAIMKIP